MDGQDDELQERQMALSEDRQVRRRRGLILTGSVLLIGLLVGLMLGRLFDSTPQAPVPTQVKVVLASWQGPELQLDREPVWQRSDQPGAVSLLLPGAQLLGDPVHGSLEQGRQKGSWRVQQSPKGVEVLVVSLAGELDVQLLPEQRGKHWSLALQVRLLGP
jgi:MSHA biogenesis protein MshN